MEKQLNNLRKAMDDTVLKGNHFTEEQKANIRSAVKNPKRGNLFNWFPKLLTAAFCLVFLIIVSDLTLKTIISPDSSKEQRGGSVNEDNDEKQTQNWEESSLFTSGIYSMIGEKGRLGFIYDNSEVTRFYPNKTQKYMWHFWGEDQEFKGKLQVVATHENYHEQITVVEGIDVGGPNNGADRHIPSLMSLPKSGMWKLDAYFGKKLFGTIFVRVYEEPENEWTYRDEYVKDGTALLSVAPDPFLESGKPFGYLFHFTAPFETFEGKELGIYAYHKETGEKITAVSPITIKEPSSGYSSLERFTANFEVPYSGMWRYEVELDGLFYADVVLFVK
jgi:hypothetical protein